MRSVLGSANMLIRQFVIDGLGHLSTMLADEDAGVAVVVDPRRDVDVYLREAAARDLRINHVLETHLHNDYVSGGRDLAALTGASHVIGAGANLAYEHRPARDGESLRAGRLEFTVLDTPGHTPEHVTYRVADRSRANDPALLLSGGSLLVGAVGRTDLLGADNAIPYAHAMFVTLRDVVFGQPDHVVVLPTHGAGSLCSTGISSTPFSTIGYERAHTPRARAAIGPGDVETFARALLAGQPTVPRYFERMRPTNQAGPALLGGRIPDPRPLTLERVDALIAAGALVIDARDPVDHALAHVPGSVSIPRGSSFGTWLGWIVEPDRELVLVLADPADWDDLARQALRIGSETALVGHLQGGFDRWIESGRTVDANRRLTVHDLAATVANGGTATPLVIDVRQASEYEMGHIPGSVHIAAGSLTERLADLPQDRPIVTICGSGYRASVAASLLRRAGFEDVGWVANGVPTWRRAGYPVERGRTMPIDASPSPAHAH
jgi:hydroxyacylglutathione hydrolase